MTRIIPLTHRRIAVVVQLLSYPLIYLIATRLGVLPSLATLLGLLAFGTISAYLYHNTGLWQSGNAPDEQLDERQVQTRNQAYRLAYMGGAGGCTPGYPQSIPSGLYVLAVHPKRQPG